MAWHRGFVICPDSELSAVCALLETQANVCRLTTRKGETAIAFTSRIIPELQHHRALTIGVDHEVANYFLVSCGNFSPTYLVPRLGLTFELVIARDCIALQSKKLQRHIKRLGQPSDQGEEEGLLASRWDLDFGIDDSRLQPIIDGLKEIEIALLQAGEPYRIGTFERWYGEVRGDLEEAADICGDPLATVVIEWPTQSEDLNRVMALADVWGDPTAPIVIAWPTQSGGIYRVTANDSEFVVETDDIFDS